MKNLIKKLIKFPLFKKKLKLGDYLKLSQSFSFILNVIILRKYKDKNYVKLLIQNKCSAQIN